MGSEAWLAREQRNLDSRIESDHQREDDTF
jgi:hypothetical protein